LKKRARDAKLAEERQKLAAQTEEQRKAKAAEYKKRAEQYRAEYLKREREVIDAKRQVNSHVSQIIPL